MVGQFTEGRRWHDLAVAVNPGSPRERLGGVRRGRPRGAAGRPARRARRCSSAPPRSPTPAATRTWPRTSATPAACVAFNGGDLETAQARYEAALASYERIGFADPLALVTYSRLASVCLLTGELDRAVQLCEECLRRCDETGEQWARGTALWVRGAARWLSGDNTAAIEDCLACLRIKESVNDLHTIAMSFDLLSVCRVATAEFELAAVLHGAGERAVDAAERAGADGARLRRDPQERGRHRAGRARRGAVR